MVKPFWKTRLGSSDRAVRLEEDMAENEAPRSSYVPSKEKRLLWWFGIYFFLQVPLIRFFPFFWLFPNGLVKFFFHIDPTVVGKPVLLLLAYSFYLAHLTLSLIIPSKRVFIILMVILIVLVSLNVTSCMNMVNEAN
ncbi:MAG: hypothetical protein LV481_14880 [Methylacidiphilales bacterium]|nr:hypothetical protein [Candidatus Methylacidiphilales bacterium]